MNNYLKVLLVFMSIALSGCIAPNTYNTQPTNGNSTIPKALDLPNHSGVPNNRTNGNASTVPQAPNLGATRGKTDQATTRKSYAYLEYAERHKQIQQNNNYGHYDYSQPRSNGTGSQASYGYTSYYDVQSSRLFSAPAQFSPKDFAGYGVLAFTTKAYEGSTERKRHEQFCRAFVAKFSSMNTKQQHGIKKNQQMVTVWPVMQHRVADKLNDESRYISDIKMFCNSAIANYDLHAAREAIKEVKRVGLSLRGRGPFLIAWSPGKNKGRPDGSVLISDLSNSTLAAHAQEDMQDWQRDVEDNPELWRNGWFSRDYMRKYIIRFADNQGARIIGAIQTLR